MRKWDRTPAGLFPSSVFWCYYYQCLVMPNSLVLPLSHDGMWLWLALATGRWDYLYGQRGLVQKKSCWERLRGARLGTGADVASSPVKPSFSGGWAFLLMLWCSERDSAPSPHTALGGQPRGKSFFQMWHLRWAVPATTSSFLLVFLCLWLVRSDVQHFCGMAQWLPKSRSQRGKKKISLVVNPWPHCEFHQTLRKQLKLFALVENGKDKSTGNCLLFCSQRHSYDYSLVGWDSFRRNGFQLKDKETGFCLVCLFWKILFLLPVIQKDNLSGCKKHPPWKWEL